MAKTITLNVGHTYALSTASGCTVTDADGVQVTAVAAGTQGVFNPPTPKITISDENAKVIPFVDAPAFFAGPGGGISITIDPNPTQGSGNAVSSGGVFLALAGKQDALTFDITPTQGSSNPITSGAVFVHTNDSARHVDAADKTGWNAAILCHEYLNTLPVGNSNFYAHYIILNEKQVPRGFLKGVSLHCRNAGTAQPSPFYLGVFEQQEGGSSDPATWSFLGVSTAAVQEVIGETREWSFDGIELAGGRTVALCSMLTPDEGWNTGAQFGLRVSERPEDDTISRVDNGAFIPQMTLSVMVMSGELVVALKKSLNELTERVTALENA
ncbi:MAG: hypothetical protein MJ074_06370 [Oscillospiraceae bacterium]|nr:hypothetical protein [Oscillospiraceae bacterium]